MSIWKKKIILCLFMAFFITSCIVKDSKGDINPTESPTISPTTIVVATETATPISLLPTSTLLPVIPTLPNEEANAFLSEMLHAGGKCELPCWLKITPGTSSHSDAYHEWASFLKMAGSTKILPKDYLYLYNFVTNNNTISILTRYYLMQDSETIESINVSTRALKDAGGGNREPVYALAAYKDILREYLLPNIFSTYGPPSQIFLSMEIISAEPTSPDFFHLWLLYPMRGAVIEYTGSAKVSNNIIHGCPSDTFVSLWLVSPNDINLYQKTLKDATGVEWSDLKTVSPFYKAPLDAIGMASSEFYETFKKPTNRCIESPLNIWPQH